VFNFFSHGKCDNIDADKFEELINEGYKIIDVRTHEENKQARIENSILIDSSLKDYKSKIDGMDKDGKYVVYCASGNRSRNIVVYMNSAGFKNVFNLSGGIMNWYRGRKKIIQG
jgi:rhodanese-related sulfurtransferase